MTDPKRPRSDDRDLSRVAQLIRAEAHSALLKGSYYACLLAVVAVAFLTVLVATGQFRSGEIPMAFAGTCGLYIGLVHALARRGVMHGTRLYVVFLVFVSMPTLFLLLAHLVLPLGAATYITGPMSYLYFFLIVLSGFLFDFRLSVLASLTAAVGYMGCYFLARPQLLLLDFPDPVMRQDYTAPSIFALKAITMIFTGSLVGASSVIARRLILRVLREEREKGRISSLFGRFVSDEVKERIIAELSATIAERKTVVVLFADIRGFSAYSETVDPHHLVVRLNEYFEKMVTAITSEGGVIDKFMGDAVMAVFGGVLELERPAEAALRAAQRMRAGLRELNARWQEQGLHPFAHGIGLDHGEVLQGTIGSEDRQEFTVIGDVVNTAARLEAMTKEKDFPILVTAAFVQELPESARAACLPLGRAQLKGKLREVEVFGVRDEIGIPPPPAPTRL